MHAYDHYATKTSQTICPSCMRPAEIVDTFTLPSTDGPAAHMKVRCDDGHVYTVLVEDVPSGN